MELWDAYLPDGRMAGQTLRRDDPIPDGLYHLVSAVLVKHTDGSYLIMQRDFNKRYFPGLLEAGASGAVQQGETPYTAALRELEEETGIHTDSLTFVFAANNLYQAIIYYYICLTDCPKDSVTLQAGETIAYQWMSEADFRRLLSAPQQTDGKPWRWLPYLEQITAFQG
ncbi:MAG TPA: NUDIX hydrolase [Candidatus Limiplasma sp.]|nr:NUDIX hydrolase [Candidatus Limiplasma sp.]